MIQKLQKSKYSKTKLTEPHYIGDKNHNDCQLSQKAVILKVKETCIYMYNSKSSPLPFASYFNCRSPSPYDSPLTLKQKTPNLLKKVFENQNDPYNLGGTP